MKYRLVHYVNGHFVKDEFTDENVIPAMEIRGYALNGLNKNSHQRAELQGQPKFKGVNGPMWDGDAVRYEGPEAYKRLSN